MIPGIRHRALEVYYYYYYHMHGTSSHGISHHMHGTTSSHGTSHRMHGTLSIYLVFSNVQYTTVLFYSIVYSFMDIESLF